jgi:uncharacterized membrane protein
MNKKLSTARDLFLYFWIFGVFGHFLELGWTFFQEQLFNEPHFPATVITFTPLAPPYGLAAAAVVLGLRILGIHRHKLRLLPEFVLQVIIGALVESISALVIILVWGSNPFWDYSNSPYNFYGLICLKNSLLFGALLLVFSRFVYPAAEKKLSEKSDKIKNDWFLLLSISYVLDLAFNIIINH